MEISPALMANMLLFSFLFGVVSGAVFDVGRAFRALIFGYPKSKKMHKFCQIKLPFSKKTICGKSRFFKAFLHIVIFFSDLLFVVFFILLVRGVRAGIRCKNYFGYMLATGITIIFIIQVCVNALVVMGSIPPTGLPFPLLSAGNTSLIVYMSAFGLLYNVSKDCEKV